MYTSSPEFKVGKGRGRERERESVRERGIEGGREGFCHLSPCLCSSLSFLPHLMKCIPKPKWPLTGVSVGQWSYPLLQLDQLDLNLRILILPASPFIFVPCYSVTLVCAKDTRAAGPERTTLLHLSLSLPLIGISAWCPAALPHLLLFGKYINTHGRHSTLPSLTTALQTSGPAGLSDSPRATASVCEYWSVRAGVCLMYPYC